MGSPVSSVIADIYIENFEEMALNSTPCPPRIYKRYVVDSFIILPTDSFYLFLNHFNNINNNIQFTIELYANNSLIFLDASVIKNPNGTIFIRKRHNRSQLWVSVQRINPTITSGLINHFDRENRYINRMIRDLL